MKKLLLCTVPVMVSVPLIINHYFTLTDARYGFITGVFIAAQLIVLMRSRGGKNHATM